MTVVAAMRRRVAGMPTSIVAAAAILAVFVVVALLAPLLAGRARLVGLSRGLRAPGAGGYHEWRACELLSLLDAEQALVGAEGDEPAA